MSPVKNKNSRDVIIPHQLRKKKKKSLSKFAKPKFVILKAGSLFKWQRPEEKEKRLSLEQCCSEKVSDTLLATLKPIPILYWPVESSTNCVSICKPCCSSVERGQQEKYIFNKRNTYSWPSNISTALEDGNISWLQRKVVFEEGMNSCFLRKTLANVYFLYWFCFNKV